jgi:hypothetical protein
MDDKITISLSKEQRDLLLKYEPYFDDHELFRLISVALKKGNNYEICLDEEQLDDLCDQIFELSENEEEEGQVFRLDDLCDYLEDCRNEFYDHEEDDEYDDYSEFSNATGAVCVLKVALAYENKIWRKIAIREGQTLHDLHNIIFDAFDRDDEHMYSFFFPHSHIKFSPRKIYDSSDEYTHPYACENQGPFSTEGENAAKTSIQSLELTKGQVFYYLFDFGDEWWHEITIEKTGEIADDGEYPRIVEQAGESPEQYDYPDEE